jgi:hypothetical protein
LQRKSRILNENSLKRQFDFPSEPLFRLMRKMLSAEKMREIKGKRPGFLTGGK